MNQKKIEKQSLIVSSIINAVITCAGLWAYSQTGLQALFIDFFFSLIAFVSTLFAVLISVVSRKRTKAYPDGMYFLEPFYSIVKSIIVIVLLASSVFSTAITAYNFFSTGAGNVINFGPVLPYTVLMVILCFGLGYYNQQQNKKINNLSTILSAESKANMVDGLQSLGIGIAIALLMLTKVDGPFGFLHYTGDFFVTIILAFISIKQPISTLLSAFRELSRGTVNNSEIENYIGKVITSHAKQLTEQPKFNIYKIGTYIRIDVKIKSQMTVNLYQELEGFRKATLATLEKKYDQVEIVYLF